MKDIFETVIFQKQKEETYDYPFYSKTYKDIVLDPFYLNGVKHPFCFRKIFSMKKFSLIGAFRHFMLSSNQNVVKSLIEESRFTIRVKDAEIYLYMYRPFEEEQLLPCILYLHGGAYVSGGIEMSANVCRAISDHAHAVVFYVDYRLAPEAPFPTALEDSYEAIQWILRHAEALRIKEEELYICGESAGGNLALGCCIKDIEKYIQRVKGCILIYPHVNMKEKIHDIYGMTLPRDKKMKKFIKKDMLTLYKGLQIAQKLYLQHKENVDDPLISPYYYNKLSKLPKMLMISAEFDCLRMQGERFAQKVYEAGGQLQIIQYKGVLHAFMNHIGYLPQAHDALKEITSFIR